MLTAVENRLNQCLVAIVLLALCTPAFAADGTRVLKEVPSMSDADVSGSDIAAETARIRERQERRIGAEVRSLGGEMDRREAQFKATGVMTVPDHEVSGERAGWTALAQQAQRVGDLHRMGFQAANLSGSGFESCSLLGVGGPVSVNDGLIYSVVRRFDCPELGEVFLSEDNFGADPSVRKFRASAPLGNIEIAGQPASFFVLRTSSGTETKSVVHHVTASTHFTLVTYSDVTQMTSKEEVFRGLAGALP